MDPWERLKCARNVPGEDKSWLRRGWLRGSQVRASNRTAVIDWLIQVQQYLSLNDQTLHLAVVNFDRVLDEVDFDEAEIELLGIACLQLASKIEEDLPIGAGLLLPLIDYYSKAELSMLEKEVVTTLKFKLRQTTAVTFLHYYSEIIGKSGKVVFRLARALLDLCLEQIWYGTLAPSLLASTVLLASSHLLGEGWPEHWAEMTDYCPSQLLASLTTVLDLVLLTSKHTNEGLEGKHARALAKIKGLEQESVQDIVKNVQEEFSKTSTNLILV